MLKTNTSPSKVLSSEVEIVFQLCETSAEVFQYEYELFIDYIIVIWWNKCHNYDIHCCIVCSVRVCVSLLF